MPLNDAPVSAAFPFDTTDLARRVADLEAQVRTLSDREAMTLCVFSGDLDKLMAAFTLANAAAACGQRVALFFTFWGTAALRRNVPQPRGKGLVERMFGWMLTSGPERQALSKLHMGGMGRALLGREMRQKGIPDLGAMIDMAKEAGVEILVCSMTMEIMGIRREELIDYPNLRVCGATQFVDLASEGKVTMFI